MKKKLSETWILGHINWYDPHSGKGSIISDDGIWYRIHEFCEIQSDNQKALKEKARVEFELTNDSVYPIIRTVRQSDKAAKPVLQAFQKTKQI
jgi:cold shock CspA family protein